MPKIRLGRKQFRGGADCELIAASRSGVSSEEVASLTRRMLGPDDKFGRVKTLNLVFFVVARMKSCCIFSSEVRLVMLFILQSQNAIGDTGACCIGQALTSNRSLQILKLVSAVAFRLSIYFEGRA